MAAEPTGSGGESLQQSTSKVDTTVELVKRLCLAESIDRMYSVEHPRTKEAIRAAYDWLAPILEREDEVVISLAEGKILVEGMPIDERNPMVAKFANSFNQVHADNLFFEKGLSYEEFENFFRVLSQGAKFINAHGGFPALLQEKGVAHIRIRQISYVMVREDQKVVGRDTHVVDTTEKGKSDKELVEYMVKEVLRKAEERRWLVAEMKNHPQKMAQLIAEGIELAASKAESGLHTEETIDSLLENIRMVCQGVVEQETSGAGEEADLHKAIMTLEAEVRARSKKLMSSETAVGFINEVLATITSFSDRIKAKQISDEFIKGERSLKQAEKLLRTLAPKDLSHESFLLRIQKLLAQHGVTDEEIAQLTETTKKKPKPRKPRVSKPLFERIAERLKIHGLGETQLEEVTTKLTTFFDGELKEQSRALKTENVHLAEELGLRDKFLEGLNLGVVIWNQEGAIEFIDPLGETALGRNQGDRLGTEVLASLKSVKFPLTALPEDLFRPNAWSEDDAKLLLAVDHVIKDSKGEIIGALLKHLPPPA